MIYRYSLANGLRVVIEDIPFVRSVSMGVWVLTGSRDENPEQSGISHFLEHMFFKGTSKLSARELAEVFDGIGGNINAYTTKEYTCFHAKVLDEHMDLAMRTLADMLFDSVFDPVELEREKRVVIEEIKMYEDNPEEAVHDQIIEATYAGHPLGANILGTEESLIQLDRQRLIDYIDSRYTPDNMVVSVSGHVMVAEVLALIETLFGGVRRETKTFVSQGPTFIPARVYNKRPIEQMHACLAVPSFAYADESMYGLILLNNILGASSSSRLFQEIREERGMAYNVFSYYSAFRDTGLFLVYFGSSPSQSQEVGELILKIVHDVLRDGVTEDELKTAKNQVIGSLLLGTESTSNRMSRIGKNELLLGRQVEIDEVTQAVSKVNRTDLHDIAQKLFQTPFSYVALGPSERSFSLKGEAL